MAEEKSGESESLRPHMTAFPATLLRRKLPLPPDPPEPDPADPADPEPVWSGSWLISGERKGLEPLRPVKYL